MISLAQPDQRPCAPPSSQCQFLIIGHGNFDPQSQAKIQRAIAAWQMPNLRAQLVPQLSDSLVPLLQAADYAFFVEPCDPNRCRPQIVPVDLGQLGDLPSDDSAAIRQLLLQTQRRWGHHPQTWALSVPQHSNAAPSLVIDRALDAIAVFLRCYTTPSFSAA